MPTRRALVDLESLASPQHSSHSSDSNMRIYRRAYLRKGLHQQEKVGIIGSGSRATQAIESAASIAIPGDLSEIRSPVRSRLYSAVTPGLPGGRGVGVPGREERGFRCPEGFQFGGRFTDSRYSTCGRMLFDMVSLGATIGRRAQRRSGRSGGDARANVRRIAGGTVAPTPVVISRAVQIPRIGDEDKEKRSETIQQAVSTLRESPDGSAVLVRRDGFALQPVVSPAELRNVPDNRNMEGAAYVVAAGKPKTIGGEELGLLSNTGVDELQYVLPSGAVLKLERSKPLSTGERRKLGRTVNQVSDIDNTNDPGARLKAVAEETGESLTYSEDLSAVPNADEMVQVGGKNVRRWVAESFDRKIKKTQGEEEDTSTPKVGEGVSEKISSQKDAIKHIEDDGDLGKIAPAVLPAALTKSKAVTTTKLDDTVKHDLPNGETYFEVSKTDRFEHLGAKVSSDVQKALGLEAPKVQLMGASGTRRPYLIEDPATTVGKSNIKPADGLSKVDPKNMLRLGASDWLLDERDRSPGNVASFKSSAGDGAIATGNPSAGLSGLTKAKISERQKLKIDEFFDSERQNIYAEAFDKRSAEQRKMLLAELDRIIERATAFNWDEYISRLSIDGELSQAEKAHLALIKGIFDNRLEALRGSKSTFMKAVGAG